MVPFNVRVLCLHTGAVRTNIFSNFTPFSLPPNSLYLPLKPRMEAIMRGEDIGPGEYMDIQRFGEQVVRDVEAGRSGIVWRGGMAGTVRWTLAVLPGWLWVCVCHCRFALHFGLLRFVDFVCLASGLHLTTPADILGPNNPPPQQNALLETQARLKKEKQQPS